VLPSDLGAHPYVLHVKRLQPRTRVVNRIKGLEKWWGNVLLFDGAVYSLPLEKQFPTLWHFNFDNGQLFFTFYPTRRRHGFSTLSAHKRAWPTPVFMFRLQIFGIRQAAHLFLSSSGPPIFVVKRSTSFSRQATNLFTTGKWSISRPPNKLDASVHFYSKDYISLQVTVEGPSKSKSQKPSVKRWLL